MNKKILIVIAAVVIVAGGVFVYISQNKKDSDNDTDQTAKTTTQSSSENSTSTGATATNAAETTITYTNTGFSPRSVTVRKGSTVVIKNNSSEPVQFSSDDHPTHRKEPELNLEEVAPGGSSKFVPTKVGSWGFHNHLDSSMMGTLVVTD